VGSIIGSINHELNSTRTALWYEVASGTQSADAWAERLRCFAGLSEMLAEQGHPQKEQGAADTRPGQAGSARRQQAQTAPRALLTEVARRAHFAAHETVYKKFRAEWEGPIARWAGTDEAIKPRTALIDEAKIVSFWAYREGVLQIAGKFAMSLPEVAEAYLRALAAWAGDDVPLAACRPAGPPACVAEDMAVLAMLWTQRYHHGVPESPEWGNGTRRAMAAPRAAARGQDTDPVTEKAEQLDGQLERLARTVVTSVLEDPTITPAGAFEAVRDDLARLLAEPADPLADQLSRAAAQLSDRILHQAPADPVLTPQQAGRLLTALTGLSGLLAPVAAGVPHGADRGGVAHGGGR
jgi:hypothetical protein